MSGPHRPAVVLVEGDSDRIALETLARRQSRDLEADGITVVAMGGAHAIEEHLRRFGAHGRRLRLAGLCDEAEERIFRDALEACGLGRALTREKMAAMGFHVCVADLEDELVRAVGRVRIEQMLEREGDLSAFRTLQHQPVWRDEAFDRQMRRWIGAGARRKLRYARLLVEALDPDAAPVPLRGVLAGI